MNWLLTFGLTNAVMATMLACVAVLVSRWLRRPALSHLLWVLVLVKLVTPPVIQVPVGWSVDISQWSASSATALAQHNLPQASSTAAPATVLAAEISRRAAPAATRGSNTLPAKPAAPRPMWPTQRTCLLAVATLWLAGSGCWLACLLWRTWRFQRFLATAGEDDPLLSAAVQRLAKQVGLSRSPRVVVVQQVVSPMLWGVGGQTCIVFPQQLRESLHGTALDSLLLHEIGHFARRDHIIRLLEMAAQVLYWWHPLVWYATRQIETAEEQCCDAWVVEQSSARRSYAEALLATIDFLSEGPVQLPPAACGLGDVPLLRARLTQIMKGKTAARLSPALRGATWLSALLILPLGPAVLASSRPEKTRLMPTAVRETTASPQALAPPPETIDPPPSPPMTTTPSPKIERLAPVAAKGQLWASATSPDGLYRIEARTGRQATLLSVTRPWRLDLTAHEIACVSFAPNSSSFATGHADAIVRIWDTSTGGLLASLKGSAAGITSLHYSPDGQRIVAGTADGNALVWRVADESEPSHQQSLGSYVSCVRWSNAGDRIAAAIGAWNSGNQSALAVWAPDENVITLQETLHQPAGALTWLDADHAVVAGGWDGQAHAFNAATGAPLLQLNIGKDVVSAAAWSADCPLLSRRTVAELRSDIP